MILVTTFHDTAIISALLVANSLQHQGRPIP
jgi:hypothetical protein